MYVRNVVTAVVLGSFLVVCAQPCFQQSKETIKTVYPEPGSKQAEVVYKQDRVLDAEGRLLRVINYLTPTESTRQGYSTQVDVFNGLPYPSQFEMYFNEKNAKSSGFLKRVDVVDSKDNLLSVRFYLDETNGFAAHSDELNSLERFPLRTAGSYLANTYEAVETSNKYNIEAPYWRGLCFVRYANEQKEIGSAEGYLIDSWSKMHQATGMEKLYSKRIRVLEKGQDIWICFQDSLLQYLSPDLDMVLQYYFIGSSVEGPTFLATYMREVR